MNTVRERARVNKSGIFGWMLFDWAAQPFHTLLITFIFARYFAAEVAPDPATGQIWWGWMLAVVGILIALLSPIMGAIADATGPRKPWMLSFSVFAFAGAAMLWFAEPGSVALPVLIYFGFALIGIEFATVFNNAVMPDLVSREELGRLSGNGWAMGYIGGVVSLIIVLGALVESSPGSGKTLLGLTPLFGLADIPGGGERATGPLTAIWYFVFVLPFFMFTPDTPKKTKVAGAVKQGLSDLIATIKSLPSRPSLFGFLGSSMLYRDALNGLFAFGGIYAGGVLGWGATQLGVFGIATAITGALGAWIGGKFDDRFGPKTVVTVSIIVLIAVCLTIISTDRNMVLFMPVQDVAGGFAPADITFYICGCLIGAAAGPIQAASRTLMADQAEDGQMTEAFGLYALSGKATAFLAPTLIAITTWALDSQRLGITPIVFLFILGLALLPFVKQNRIH
jgi:UMF1 family MFS transporter